MEDSTCLVRILLKILWEEHTGSYPIFYNKSMLVRLGRLQLKATILQVFLFTIIFLLRKYLYSKNSKRKKSLKTLKNDLIYMIILSSILQLTKIEKNDKYLLKKRIIRLIDLYDYYIAFYVFCRYIFWLKSILTQKMSWLGEILSIYLISIMTTQRCFEEVFRKSNFYSKSRYHSE